MCRALLAVLMAFAMPVATMRADSCDGPPAIRVPAVCGQTLLGVGWTETPEGTPHMHAMEFSRQQVQLRRGDAKVAETTSDENGRFAFPRVPRGEYLLTVPYTEWIGIDRIITVTGDRVERCTTPIFLYLAEKGAPCRTYSELIRPLRLVPDAIHPKP